MYKQRSRSSDSVFIHPIARRELDKRNRIIDIGCDIGRLKNIFPNKYLIGVDKNRNSNICIERGYKEFHCIDIERDTLESVNADGMIISHVLEHLIRPENAIMNVIKGLKPGSCVYISCPTRHNKKYYHDYTHIRPFTEESMTHLLEDCDLVNIELLYQVNTPVRGTGKILEAIIKKDPIREQLIAKRWRFLRSRANVHAICFLPINRL